MGRRALPIAERACVVLPLDAGILCCVVALAAGCLLLALQATLAIVEWELAVMAMLARRGTSTRVFMVLTVIELVVLLGSAAIYALGSLKTRRLRQRGPFGAHAPLTRALTRRHPGRPRPTPQLKMNVLAGEPELVQLRLQLRPSLAVTVTNLLAWVVRVTAWVPSMCSLEGQLAEIRCRDIGYPEDGPDWDRLRGQQGCATVEPAWCVAAPSRAGHMCDQSRGLQVASRRVAGANVQMGSGSAGLQLLLHAGHEHPHEHSWPLRGAPHARCTVLSSRELSLC